MARDDEKYTVDYEETIQDERTEQESNDIKRRLLNLPQQPSYHGSRGRKGGQNPSSSNPLSGNRRKNDESNDNQKRREDRDNQAKNRNRKGNGKTSNNRDQARTGDQRNNPNKLTQKVKEKGKDKLKDQAQKSARQATRKAVGKNIKRKGAKQAIKTGAKVAGKALKKMAIKGLALASKALLALAGTVGLPVLLIGIGILFLIFILMSLSSASLGTGNGSDELGEEAQELRDYIVKASESTIDPDKPEQQMYKVPEELLAAIVQLDSWLEDPDGEEQLELDRYKDLIDEFTEDLKPDFEYETFTEWTETRTKECKKEETQETTNTDGETVEETVCIEYGWSEPTRTEQEVEKITKVVAWNGTGTYEYEGEESEWEGDSESQTRTYRYVIKSQNFDYDYTKLDNILTSHEYELEDKKWFEYFYESGTETPMHYIEWLETGTVNFNTGGGYYFNGEIIPGGGVPPQYMPYYRAAEEKYGVPWYILASIHFHETTFSTNPSMMSSVGAIGHMQFMPLTWLGFNYPGGTALGNASIPDNILTDPAQIARYGGYGTDANGDGRADPWDLEDAIHTAAKYLAKNGYAQNPRKAIRAYNRSDTYVNNILATAEEFKNAATYKPDGLPEVTPGDFMVPVNGALKTSDFGMRWGKKHAGMDMDVAGADTAPVVAAASGIVIRSYLSSSYGNCIIIRHNINGTQYETLYAHLNNRAVSEGQTVQKGQYIGMMGNTGNSTATHLHFEIHQPAWATGQPNALNPALFINVPPA